MWCAKGPEIGSLELHPTAVIAWMAELHQYKEVNSIHLLKFF